jgi:uncharacterized repeat protein (TIGR01451 family)
VAAVMVSYRTIIVRRWRVAVAIAACVAVGALVSALVLPSYFSNAASTAISSISVTGTDTVSGATAASSDAPGGLKSATAKSGEKIKWVVPYENKTSGNATVNLKAMISNGTFVPGSLQLPALQNASGTLTPQYTTDGTTWVTKDPGVGGGVTGVGYTGDLRPMGTQQLSLGFPNPTSNVVATSGGDAYNVVVKGSLIYAVYHHRTNPFVFCSKMDGTTCPGWPTNSNVQSWSSTVGTAIGTGTAFDGWSAWQGGTWISGNKLFWFVGLSSAITAGTACLDLSTTTPTSCGYTPLAANQTVGFNNGAQIGSTAMQASNGNIYAVVISGGKDLIVCVNPATGASCGNLALNTGVTTPYILGAAVFGSYTFASVQKTTGDSWQTYCYVAGGQLCSGSWPVTTSSSVAFGPTPFAPILSKTGSLTGVCTIKNGQGSAEACWNLSGVPTTDPYNGVNAQYTANGNAAGDTLVLGTKVYVSRGDTVACVDYSLWSGTGRVPACDGFATPINRINYTVRTAYDVAPNCLVATGDAGQITFFNAFTGSGCSGTSGPVSMTVSPLTSYCGSGTAGFTGWGALTLPGLVTGAYTNATVTLKDQNNAVISGFNNATVPPGGSLSLSSIPKTVTSITATVTINGVNDPLGVTGGRISITWLGSPVEMCFQTTAPPVACDASGPIRMFVTANVVTTSAGGNDAPNGNSSGFDGSPGNQAGFVITSLDSECKLTIFKYINGKPGPASVEMGTKITYTIVIANDGTQPYDNASWSDDLSDVLKEADYNNDARAGSGTVSYSAPVLSWTGSIAAGYSARVDYTVTIKNPAKGDHSLVNTVVSKNRNNNCMTGSQDPQCSVIVTVLTKDVIWHKVDDSGNIIAGSEWSFTPVDAQGNPTGPSLAVTDCVAADATQCTGADRDPLGGIFRLDDLGPGNYRLVETKAPIGFKLSSTPITVTVTTGTTTIALQDVVNKQLPVPAIPFTGGIGTDFLTFTGGGLFALVLALAGVQLIRRRRTV